jgi:hypothetical protein
VSQNARTIFALARNYFVGVGVGRLDGVFALLRSSQHLRRMIYSNYNRILLRPGVGTGFALYWSHGISGVRFPQISPLELHVHNAWAQVFVT